MADDNSGWKASTSQFGPPLDAYIRAIAIAFKCPHPGWARATLKHSPSINDLLSSGMVSQSTTVARLSLEDLQTAFLDACDQLKLCEPHESAVFAITIFTIGAALIITATKSPGQHGV
jgi:hypothetical protein